MYYIRFWNFPPALLIVKIFTLLAKDSSISLFDKISDLKLSLSYFCPEPSINSGSLLVTIVFFVS